MPYTRPPLQTFQALYPAFRSLTELEYDAWATKVEAKVNDRYSPLQQDATELLLAHYLTINSVGIGATSKMANEGATSFRDGSFSATISDDVVAARHKGGYGATVYGRQFADIQRRLFGGPRLVPGGC